MSPATTYSPAEVAASVYQKEWCRRTFAEDLEAHLLNGVVHSTPDYFLMARKVRKDAPVAEILDPYSPQHENPDCWLVWLYAGNIRRAFEQADVRLPWVAFQKRNRLKFYTWEKIHQKTRRFFS